MPTREKRAKTPGVLKINFLKCNIKKLNHIMQNVIWQYQKVEISNISRTKFLYCQENFLQSYYKNDCVIQKIYYSYDQKKKSSIDIIDEFFTNLSIEARVKIKKMGHHRDEKFCEMGPIFFEFFNILVDINKKALDESRKNVIFNNADCCLSWDF